MSRVIDVDGDLERLSPDDEAQRCSELFVEAALQQQRERALTAPTGIQGVCSNCQEQCLPTAVYCDEDCRTDHEARERKRLRGAVA